MISKLRNSVIGLVLAVWMLLVFLPQPAHAQGALMQLPPLTTSMGQPIAGATISVFTTTGSLPSLVCSTPVTVYKDVALTIPFTVLVTDGNGNFPFFISPSANPYGYTVSGVGTSTSLCYGFSAPIPPTTSPALNSLTLSSFLKLTETTAQACAAGFDFLWGDSAAHRPKVCDNNGAATTLALFTDNLGVFASTTSAQLAGVISDETGTGVVAYNTSPQLVTPSIDSLNGLAQVFADRFTNVQTAMNACPSAGCIVYATSPNVNLALGALDPGANTKPIWLFLGPFAFTATQITLRSNFHIVGAGRVTGSSGTFITSVGTNAQPLFVIPQSNNSQINGVELGWFSAVGLAGNTSQEGLLADVSGFTNSGLVHFYIHDLDFNSFVGSAIHLKGRPSDASSANQLGTFFRVTATRPSGSNPVLKMEGYAGQISFYDCEFDGAAINDGTNIYIGAGSGVATVAPLTTYFHNLTSQNGTVAINVDGAQILEIDGLHDENTSGSVSVTAPGAMGAAGNQNITIHDSYFASNVGVNAGNGFLLNVSDSNATVFFEKNSIFGTPDKVCKLGAGTPVLCRNNIYTISPTAAAPTTGVTPTLAPAATLDIRGYTHAFLSTSATQISTLKGSQLPGESVVFTATGGTVQFITGGNISLGTYQSPLILQAGESAAFLRTDAGASAFVVISVSSVKLPNFYVSQRNKVAAITTTTITTTSVITLYGVRGEVACDSAVGATTAVLTIAWTDTSNTAQTGAVTANCAALGASSRANAFLNIQPKAGTTITYAVAITGTPTYDVSVSVEQLGTN